DDGFLVSYAPTAPGSASYTLRYATRIGGTNTDNALAVAANSSFVFVAGSTCSSDFKASPPTLRTGGAVGGCDAYVQRFTTAGVLKSSTFLRGSRDDAARGIAIGADGAVYVAGSTSSTDFVGAGTTAGG